MPQTEYLPGAFISVAGFNLHASGCTAVAYTKSVDEEDASSLASGGWYEAAGGQSKGSLTLEINNNSDLETALSPLVGTVVVFELRKTTAVASATNLKRTGKVFLKEWNPVNSAATGLNKQSQTWATSGPVVEAVS